MATITPAGPADLPAILDLLAQHGLPHAGLADHIGAALVVRDGATVVGSAALEHYGQAALLRSLAVAPAQRGQGLGRQLTAASLELARRLGVRQLYLLTTTAEGYFPRFGFRPIPRAEVAPAVQVSAEFTGACPDSAVALALDL
jgi:amino-acid N-acetyltransferase